MLRFVSEPLQSLYTGLSPVRLEARAEQLRSAAQNSQHHGLRRDAATTLQSAASLAARSQRLTPLAQLDRHLIVSDAARHVQLRPTASRLATVGVALGAMVLFVPKAVTAALAALIGAGVGLMHVVAMRLGLASPQSATVRSSTATPDDATATLIALSDIEPLTLPAPVVSPLGASLAKTTFRDSAVAQWSQQLIASAPPSPSSGSTHSAPKSRSNSVGSTSTASTLPDDGIDFDWGFSCDPARWAYISLPVDADGHHVVTTDGYPVSMSLFDAAQPLAQQFVRDIVRANGPVVFHTPNKAIRVDRLMQHTLPNNLSFIEQHEHAHSMVTPLLTKLCDNKPHWAHAVSQVTHQGFWAELVQVVDTAWSIAGERMRMPLIHQHLHNLTFDVTAPDAQSEHSGHVVVRGEMVWQPLLGEEHGIETLEVASHLPGARPRIQTLHSAIFPPQPLKVVATVLVAEPVFNADKGAFDDVVPTRRIEVGLFDEQH